MEVHTKFVLEANDKIFSLFKFTGLVKSTHHTPWVVNGSQIQNPNLVKPFLYM